MQTKNVIMVAILAATGLFIISRPAEASVAAYAATCLVDQEISATDQAAADSAAINLAQNFMGGNSDQLRAEMSKDGQSDQTAADIAKIVQAVEAMGPFENIHVLHTYLIQVTGGANPMPPMVCGKSLIDPDRVEFRMLPIPKQFYVEITGHTINNDWSLFVWLIPEGGALKAQSFSLNPSAISGRSSQDLTKLASYQNSQGNSLNAVLLYKAAVSVSECGPNAEPFSKQELDKSLAAFSVPQEVAGKPPYVWHLGDQNFEIQNLGVIGVQGELGVVLDRRLDAWPSDDVAEQNNRDFVVSVMKAYPQLAQSFSFIVAKAFKPNESGGFSTVYVFGKGFE